MATGPVAFFSTVCQIWPDRCSARHYKRNMAAMTDKTFPLVYFTQCEACRSA